MHAELHCWSFSIDCRGKNHLAPVNDLFLLPFFMLQLRLDRWVRACCYYCCLLSCSQLFGPGHDSHQIRWRWSRYCNEFSVAGKIKLRLSCELWYIPPCHFLTFIKKYPAVKSLLPRRNPIFLFSISSWEVRVLARFELPWNSRASFPLNWLTQNSHLTRLKAHSSLLNSSQLMAWIPGEPAHTTSTQNSNITSKK